MNQHIPLRMAENRVWRIYLGGKLLDELRGVTGSDGYFPEDWLASVVQANNPDREEKPDREGLSRVELPDGENGLLKGPYRRQSRGVARQRAYRKLWRKFRRIDKVFGLRGAPADTGASRQARRQSPVRV